MKKPKKTKTTNGKRKKTTKKKIEWLAFSAEPSHSRRFLSGFFLIIKHSYPNANQFYPPPPFATGGAEGSPGG